MPSAFPDINIKRLIKQTVILSSILFSLLTALPEALAQPVVMGAGMNPGQSVWVFDREAKDADKEVTFWFRVQKQSILNRFGTFDYYFKTQVLRPDGSEVWNTTYGFNEEGYAAEKLTFPVFFYDRSPNKLSPAFGTWKVRTAIVERESKREVSVREYSVAFTGEKKQPASSDVRSSGEGGHPFPVPSFQYKQWRLKRWGVGIYGEVSIGSNTYDREVRAVDVRDTFSVNEAMSAWDKGHKFGAMLEGPPVNTYVNSNNLPLYVFGYILKHPDGDNNGQDPRYRSSSYCNNPGAALFTFDVRKPGRYRIEFLLRERDKPSWEESSWVPIGGIDFTLTQ
ncbi:MAG TPA: hypothetical protein PKH03_10465 [Syntrophales bacterium]|nr:hypothetical protein [Syntrophales bacterium]